VDRPQATHTSSPARINDYLSRFKSGNIASPEAQADSENALDQYLLERTAKELRAALTRRGKLDREIGREGDRADGEHG